jgi:hypothetical protein
VALFDLTDQVRDSIQSTLYRLLVQRRSVWRYPPVCTHRAS